MCPTVNGVVGVDMASGYNDGLGGGGGGGMTAATSSSVALVNSGTMVNGGSGGS